MSAVNRCSTNVRQIFYRDAQRRRAFCAVFFPLVSTPILRTEILADLQKKSEGERNRLAIDHLPLLMRERACLTTIMTSPVVPLASVRATPG